MQLLRSLLFTGFFMLWSFVYASFFVLASLLLPFRGRFALARVYAHSVLVVLRWTCGLNYRVEGRENLPAGNHIALIKHASTWETVAQMVLLPPQVWVLKRELTWLPAFGWGLILLRSIAVNRGAGASAVKSVLEQGKARLAEGKWVVIFPEGTRMPPGETRRYGVSGALLAARERPADRAGRTRCGIFLAAARPHKEAGNHPRRHRPADRRRRARPARRQRRGAGVDRAPLAPLVRA